MFLSIPTGHQQRQYKAAYWVEWVFEFLPKQFEGMVLGEYCRE
jgi:hypothetical protein